MKVVCAHCQKSYEAQTGRVNRARKLGAALYCNRACAGMPRRRKVELAPEEKKRLKSEYDKARRQTKGDAIREQKRAFYYANHERMLAEEAKRRPAKKEYQAAYIQSDRYKAWKKEYDVRHLAQKHYGEFWEVALELKAVDTQLNSVTTNYERNVAKGTINKAQTRRRAL